MKSKAPTALRNSVQDLVTYMKSFSKEPRILARGFYVWISENIREANIPVQIISGFSKGVGYSADKPVTLSSRTDHEWNAIELDGNWYLIDCTWGSGHMESGSNVKEFEDFYFLTDPKFFIFDHFPYMNGDLKESQKRQLLSRPIGLQEFNNNVTCKPAAFKLGIQAVSHPDGYIKMKNELRMRFRCTRNEDIYLSARLMLKEEDRMIELGNATFAVLEKGSCMLLVHPPRTGLYTMKVFGKYCSDESRNDYPQVFEYVINCTEVREQDFEYPKTFAGAITEKTILHQPLRGKLPQNTKITFKVSAPNLQNIRVGKETYLNKRGNMFTGEVKTGTAGNQLPVWGTRGDEHSELDELYCFFIC